MSATDWPVAAGQDLSAREVEVFQGLADGLTREEVGKRLYISVNTVRKHIYRVSIKLCTHNAAHSMAEVMKRGLVK